MAVLGVGGAFVKSADPDRTKAWYRDRLGVNLNECGGMDFQHKTAADQFGANARTVFERFKAQTSYFAPSEHAFMINLIVDDLDALVAALRAAGEPLIGEPEAYDYGKFAWVIDPDGVKVELWEPVPA